LNETDRRSVENLLRFSPLAQAELAWLRRLRQQIQTSAALRRLPPSDAGLDRLMKMIDAEKKE
jgi:hypothetical protein